MDRDQRMDLLVTHLFDPVSLLVNRTANCGGAVSLKLKAIRGAADAWGTIVSYRLEGREVKQQLICGAGYQGANDRFLLLPVGNAKAIDELRILWPDGSIEVLNHLKTGTECIAVQGEKAAFELDAP